VLGYKSANANGNGGTQDYAEAGKWYRKAAEQGDAEAQFNLDLLLNKIL
jgi:TPR repeat protein